MARNIVQKSPVTVYGVVFVPVLAYCAFYGKAGYRGIDWPFVFFLLIYAVIVYLTLRSVRMNHRRENREKERSIEALERELWENKALIQDFESHCGTSPGRYTGEFFLHMDSYDRLTQCEKELLRCIKETQVLSTRELSRLFSVSEFTMNNRIYHLCEKLGLETRAMLLVYVMGGRFP